MLSRCFSGFFFDLLIWSVRLLKGLLYNKSDLSGITYSDLYEDLLSLLVGLLAFFANSRLTVYIQSFIQKIANNVLRLGLMHKVSVGSLIVALFS